MELHHLALVIVLSCCISAYALNADTDREALLSFKLKVSDPLNALRGWNSSLSLCTWFGVSCTPNGTQVRSLSLGGLGLSGTIPPQLSNLTSLKTLDLSDNLFHGPIPQEFSSLSLLQLLRLANNSIDGTIPASLSRISNLKKIYLQSNKLIGKLPSELGFLLKLETFDVAANNLTGPIPPSFGNLSSLTSLYLAKNQFTGRIPKELGRLRNLHNLQLSENRFSGEIPYSIYNISSIDYFSATKNKLVGKLPPNMGHTLPNLRELFMAQNELDGPIPSSLSNLSGIESLDLSSNSFHGVLPLFGNLHKLIYLNLGLNGLSSTTELNHQVFDSLTNCSRLKNLMLNSNQLSGELPSMIANQSIHLEQFCVDGNSLSGSFPGGMENYRNLTVLSLHQNDFQGTVPNSIGLLHNLRKFSLHRNMFFGEIPDSFSNLTKLYQLTMGNNRFSGRIPKSIGDCHHLRILGLVGNWLNGSMPKEIFGLSHLHELRLARNTLNGSLPAEVGGLNQLSFMDISDNQLSDDIPATLGDCSSLRNLSMARNKFNGSIPKSMGRLAALESLDLSSNNLSGPIPNELENLRVLNNLNLSFNDLEGQVPSKGIFLDISWDSLQGNNMLCSDDQDVIRKLKVPTCAPKKKRNGSVALKIIGPIASLTALLCVLFCFLWVLISLNKKKKRIQGLPDLIGQLQKISYSDILSATNGLAPENLIGKGGFGSVYRGVVSSGDHSGNNGEDGASTIVAIKVLDLKQRKASQSFTLECEALKNVRHRNLVKVITSCSSINHGGGEFKALVMEFMSNGSLDKWLYPEDPVSGSSLNLIQRLNIAIDVAAAMDYLHHDCDPPIVHCDMKPGNVLLDDDMVAHVGDFGLARFLSHNPSQNQSSTIGLKGSIGYIAPEYGLGCNVSTSGDVYSYGILLLEIFVGKKPTDEMFKDGQNLNKFASAVYENRVLEIIDSRLLENDNAPEYNSSTTSYSVGTSSSSSSSNIWQIRKEMCLDGMIKVGLSCAADSAKDRLTMRETLKRMHEIKRSLLEI